MDACLKCTCSILMYQIRPAVGWLAVTEVSSYPLLVTQPAKLTCNHLKLKELAYSFSFLFFFKKKKLKTCTLTMNIHMPLWFLTIPLWMIHFLSSKFPILLHNHDIIFLVTFGDIFVNKLSSISFSYFCWQT